MLFSDISYHYTLQRQFTCCLYWKFIMKLGGRIDSPAFLGFYDGGMM